MGRILVLTAVSIVLLVTLVPPAAAERMSHPYFGDRGTLNWYRRLDDAKEAARRQGKVVFIEYGRLRCPTCRVLVSNVLPSSQVRSRISRAAVGLAAECDHPEAAVRALFQRHLAGARSLPFVAFLKADGTWISGFAGGTSAPRFLVHLRKAEEHLARQGTRTAPPPRPRPVVRTPSPVRVPGPCVSPDAPRPNAPAPRPSTPLPPPATPNPYPSASLHGDPDATSAEPPCAGCTPPTVRRTGPLPLPRVIINPPVRVARGTPRPKPPPVATPVARAREAASSGEWSQVLAMAREAPQDARLADLTRQAHRWAHRELDQAVAALEEQRFEDALTCVKAVLLQMHGQPEGVDAEAGLGAIRTMLELRYLDPKGAVAPVVRQNSFEELRGTRWARLFD